MKLPSKIILNSEVYEIIYFDNKDDIPGSDFTGLIDFELGKLWIYRGPRSKEAIMKTIIHEIFHFVVKEQHMDWLRETDKEEQTVDIFANSIVDFMIRNKFIKME